MKNIILFIAICLIVNFNANSQEVPILNISTNNNGQVEIEVESSEDKYYILNTTYNAQRSPIPTSMTLGKDGKTVITEPLSRLGQEAYQVLEYDISNPTDTDGDNLDDIFEYNNMPKYGPINFAESIELIDGAISIDNLITYKALSVEGDDIWWAPFLNGREFVKFVIVNINSDNPEVYFINSETHYIHAEFIFSIGLDYYEDDITTGEIVYYPNVPSNNGTLGDFSFNFSFGFLPEFEKTQKTHELLAANMPFLKNNLSLFVTESEEMFGFDESVYEGSRIPLLYESEVFNDIDYLSLHVAEGYGLLRVMDLDETPGSRDVVLYESLPNTLPRVAGIMTSFIQTPLSHVNLRAIQDNVPNAFIRDPLLIDSISSLVGKFIYYKVEQTKYTIREATLDEVNEWFEEIRPKGEQLPVLNLDRKDILPLDDIRFEMSDGFGAKCANVATMRTFGFPEGTIPNGFGVPFHYYQEFMKHNGFFDRIKNMLENPDFQSQLNVQLDMLKDLRSDIKKADMPQWMLDDLQAMHDQFPDGTSVRCRSSTNNEDLPGFSGAGLYTSKTQHPDEGHISKSIKQVYASMWNFRAFDARDFYRINHYVASMGVLCHPNSSDELANGVGVTTDPIYQTDNTFYLNTQVGEDLVTNPESMSIPEEILLDKISVIEDDYRLIRNSSLLPGGELIMEENYRDQIRDHMNVIHDEFEKLYEKEGSEDFAIDIEYKILSNGQLFIKQARPWASFWSELDPILNNEDINLSLLSDVKIYPNPVDQKLMIDPNERILNTRKITISNLTGQEIKTISVDQNFSTIEIKTDDLISGIYFIEGFGQNNERYFSKKFVKKN